MGLSPEPNAHPMGTRRPVTTPSRQLWLQQVLSLDASDAAVARGAAGSRSGGEMTGNSPRATRWWWSQPSIMQGGRGQGLAETSASKRLRGDGARGFTGQRKPPGPSPACSGTAAPAPPLPSCAERAQLKAALGWGGQATEEGIRITPSLNNSNKLEEDDYGAGLRGRARGSLLAPALRRAQPLDQ